MKLVKGKKAETKKGMQHNYETMKDAGYSKKRSMGTAYGEVGMAKKASKDESKAMKKTMDAKHKGKKDMHYDMKEDKKMIKKMVKKDCMKK